LKKEEINMRAQKKAEELAAQRVQLLSPLLVGGGLDPAKARKIRAEICKQTGLSDHTLRRYLTKYREDGFEELKPKSKERSQAEDAIPQHILEQAILLHREIPNRNVAQIIQILEWEGKVRHGQIKRSTLQEKLANRGYNTQHMRMYSQSGGVTRRYQ
jgi:putative transposase